MTHKTKIQSEGKSIKALIFDLDGVITQTRKTHKKAWKEMFGGFFEERCHGQASMTESDYQEYIDGKPRYQGVRSFLASRGIELPYGSKNDEPGYDTVCALGNSKNMLFNNLLERDGVEVYEDALEKLKEWRSLGLKTAIVSSSKNCREIIEVAGISNLFDTRVDGVVSEELGLKGKPDPDIFTEAARRLGVRVENSVVFEDASSGVKAGQRGYFGLVVGISRFDNAEALMANGADITIDDFVDFDLHDQALHEEFFTRQGIPIFPDNDEIFTILAQKKPVIFLDYDGTLSPIVPRPEDAIITPNMKESLKKLAEIYTVAIVTGRDKEDVESLVGLDELIYAGSHGYIISGPNDLFMEHPDSEKIVPRLDAIEKEVISYLEDKTEGTQVDRKRYAIGIHYRNARPEDEKVVLEIVDEILKKHPGHKKGEGKKIIEIKPDLDWHKGKAVLWILDALNMLENSDVMPVFIGDDITDEDGFEALKDMGLGILVGGHGQPTAAKYALKNVFQVKVFFKKLIEMHAQKP
ncbi:MAG: trehalose-phosphatase [Bacteroidales bacterium]